MRLVGLSRTETEQRLADLVETGRGIVETTINSSDDLAGARRELKRWSDLAEAVLKKAVGEGSDPVEAFVGVRRPARRRVEELEPITGQLALYDEPEPPTPAQTDRPGQSAGRANMPDSRPRLW